MSSCAFPPLFFWGSVQPFRCRPSTSCLCKPSFSPRAVNAQAPDRLRYPGWCMVEAALECSRVSDGTEPCVSSVVLQAGG